jgi:hypothetical protein
MRRIWGWEFRQPDCQKETNKEDSPNLYLQAAQEWGNTWYIILNSIHDSVNQETEKKYKIIDMKLNTLMQTQEIDHDYLGKFYLWVIN